MNGSSWWQQVLAAVVAAIIPVVVKVLNDLKARLEVEANSEVPIVGLHSAPTNTPPQPPADPTPPKGVQAPGTGLDS